eukprot:PhM_4_TR2809/c0_g1_i1/m.83454
MGGEISRILPPTPSTTPSQASNNSLNTPSAETAARSMSPGGARMLGDLYVGSLQCIFNHDKVFPEFGIRSIVSCVTSDPEHLADVLEMHSIPREDYLLVPLEDNRDQYNALTPLVDATVDFIHQRRLECKSVLVHCDGGITRSPSVVVAYLMKYGPQTFEGECCAAMGFARAQVFMRQCRAKVNIRLFADELQKYEITLNRSSSSQSMHAPSSQAGSTNNNCTRPGTPQLEMPNFSASAESPNNTANGNTNNNTHNNNNNTTQHMPQTQQHHQHQHAGPGTPPLASLAATLTGSCRVLFLPDFCGAATPSSTGTGALHDMCVSNYVREEAATISLGLISMLERVSLSTFSHDFLQKCREHSKGSDVTAMLEKMPIETLGQMLRTLLWHCGQEPTPDELRHIALAHKDLRLTEDHFDILHCTLLQTLTLHFEPWNTHTQEQWSACINMLFSDVMAWLDRMCDEGSLNRSVTPICLTLPSLSSSRALTSSPQPHHDK